MSTAFIDRNPTAGEVEQLRLAMSTFSDGSGQERDPDGSTRAGWRDLERLTAEILGGRAPQNKDVFDVILSSNDTAGLDFGISVKSKQLARTSAIGDLENGGRVYMELCNSPAKLWKPLKEKGLAEASFGIREHASEFGRAILETIEGWYVEYRRNHEAKYLGHTLDIEMSVHLVFSYSKPRTGRPRLYQLHSFDLLFPDGIEWEFSTDRCLRGYDPEHPAEALFDAYLLSGGQVKFYPMARQARFASPQFVLETAPTTSIATKANLLWPDLWSSTIS